MQRVTLGESGLSVSPIASGTWQLSREGYFAVRKAVLGFPAPKLLDARGDQK